LCVVSGSEGCGKSTLLAWLVMHGSREATVAARAVHAVAPYAGDSVRGLIWALADQLDVVARAPGELRDLLARDTRRTVIVVPDLRSGAAAESVVAALAGLSHLRLIVEARTGSPAHAVLTGRGWAELDLDLPQWTDQRRLEEWRSTRSADADAATVGRSTGPIDLSDPAAVCAAGPWQVTAAYEAETDDSHGGLRDAWFRSGQSLCREQDTASRALVLRTALSESADPRHAAALDSLARLAPWKADWGRVKGDISPPWPGPVAALAAGAGPLGGALLCVDHLGTVRAVDIEDALPRARIAPDAPDVLGLCSLSDGTLLTLDEAGRVHADHTRAVRAAQSGIEALLTEKPDETRVLLDTVQGTTGTAIASAPSMGADVVVLGDAGGRVQVFGGVTGSAVLHRGRVTAVAGVAVPTTDERTAPLFYSGGADGTVRAWAPGLDPLEVPVAARRPGVVALDVVPSGEGVVLGIAWEDGLVRLHSPEGGWGVDFRPGGPVRALAVASDRSVVIGMDESLIRLTVAPDQPPVVVV
jgi:hypothetical protein